MIWLVWVAAVAVSATADPYGIPAPFGYPFYRSYQQPSPYVVSAPQVVVEQVVEQPVQQYISGPPLPGPPAPPPGQKCPVCEGPECCELCVERSCAVPEDLSILELALNPFFYVQYVEDCPQGAYIDNVCFLFVPLLDLASLFTFGQIITYQDGTVEQRQYEIECINDAYQFTAIGSGCRFKFEIIYADILCGVYVFQRCFENPCCQVDSGPIHVVSNLLPAAQQCLSSALEFVQNLYPCKKFIELPQENASLCTVLGNTLVPNNQ
ncbi:uncharacterized protein LOC128998627 [Macrosteles quadrilineatus]|uniref:uncharacterized protein LOC128998627 n=1 Tax=Macrosteles quadrilineatus TaxID=74068 RepID=UPI0023E2374A|nr:uncharacterized protein LOC128998627 [Macrosteles quadrilineatus]